MGVALTRYSNARGDLRDENLIESNLNGLALPTLGERIRVQGGRQLMRDTESIVPAGVCQQVKLDPVDTRDPGSSPANRALTVEPF